jgi:hypothetical protein
MSSFHAGQILIWWQRNAHHPHQYRQVDATFIEYVGRISAVIHAEGKHRTVRLENIEAAKVKPSLIRAGRWVE